MTRHDSPGRDIARWLHGQAGDGGATYLDDILRATARMPQRSRWTSIERWLPMDILIPQPVVAPRRVGFSVVATALLLVGVVLAALLAGSPRPRPSLGIAGNGVIAYLDGTALEVANADGTSPRTVLSGLPRDAHSLVWSPDGTRLAFRVPGPAGTIEIIDPDGGHRLSVSAPHEGGERELAWSPDSSRVAFAYQVGETSQIAIAWARDGKQRPLLDGADVLTRERSQPSWSPDGRLIAFVAAGVPDVGARRIGVVGVDGTGERLLDRATPASSTAMGWGGWAPTTAALRILYVDGNNDSSPSTVNVLDVASGRDRAFARGFWPTWSPDASQIAWFGDGPRITETAAVFAARDGLLTGRRLQADAQGAYCQDNPQLAGQAICSAPWWSPDGRWVYGPDMVGSSIVAIPVQGGKPIRVDLEHRMDLANGPTSRVAWQPVVP